MSRASKHASVVMAALQLGAAAGSLASPASAHIEPDDKFVFWCSAVIGDTNYFVGPITRQELPQSFYDPEDVQKIDPHFDGLNWAFEDAVGAKRTRYGFDIDRCRLWQPDKTPFRDGETYQGEPGQTITERRAKLPRNWYARGPGKYDTRLDQAGFLTVQSDDGSATDPGKADADSKAQAAAAKKQAALGAEHKRQATGLPGTGAAEPQHCRTVAAKLDGWTLEGQAMTKAAALSRARAMGPRSCQTQSPTGAPMSLPGAFDRSSCRAVLGGRFLCSWHFTCKGPAVKTVCDRRAPKGSVQ